MKLNKKPLVVIAIATLGERITIVRTLESIEKQTYQEIEVKIVCPERQIKHLRDLVNQNFSELLKVDFIPEQSRGLSKALNQAFNESRNAKFFGWINDDDFLTDTAIERAVTAMESCNTIAAFGQLIYVDEKLNKLALNNFGKIGYWISKYGPNLIPQPGCIFRSSAIKEKDLLNENFKYAMDLDLWFRLERIGKFSFIDQPQALMVWHKDSITIRERTNSLKEAFEIRKKHRKNFLEYVLINILWLPTKVIAHLSTKII